MPFLVRRINRELWPDQGEIDDIANLAADSISDLKTTGNCLSVWYVQDKIDAINGIIALLFDRDTTFESIDSNNVVIFDYDLLTQSGFKIACSPSTTDFIEMRDKHFNLEQLDYQKLGLYSEKILEILNQAQEIMYESTEIKTKIADYIKTGRIKRQDLTHKRLERLYDRITTL